MRLASSLLALSLATAGCDDDTKAPAKAPSSTKPSAVATDDDEIETVDDTIPPDDLEPATGPDAGDDEEEGDEGEHEDACAPKDSELKPMQVLSFTFTDGIEGRDPKSKLQVAKAGQRVYAHLAMRNRSGRKRCLHLTFRVGGKKRTEVTLKIGKSWRWRTYAYNTIHADDDKPLQLTVTDDQGALVLEKMLPVIPRKD
jgi:hypothetical protein